jgi:hypothetical protein
MPHMKRFLVIAAFITAVTTVLPAVDVVELGFLPMNPAVMAQGGADTATAQGWDAFFSNPAGFSYGQGDLTILQAGAWLYARPDRAIALVQEVIASGASASLFTSIGDEITGGGFGVGASMGIGYAGKGLGLGMAIITDSYFWGPTLPGLAGDITATVGFMGGMSFPLPVGPFTFHVGGSLRPMVRIHTLLPNADASAFFTSIAPPVSAPLLTALGSANAVYGVGVGLDLGVIAELGWFTLGLSARDIGGTVFNYSTADFATVSSVFGSELRLPPGAPVTERYVIPMDVSFGASFHPVFGNGKVNKILDTTLHVELTDLVHTIGDAVAGDASIWKMVHAGAELRLLSVFSAWAGLNQGYFTFGAGLDLFVVDLNLAVFTRELGDWLGDRPSSGASLEIAVRL